MKHTNITANMIRAAAHYGRFGESDPAQVVCEGLVQIAAGFRTGGTVTSILKDMGLIGKKSGNLTNLGRSLLWDITGGQEYVSRLSTERKAAAEGAK